MMYFDINFSLLTGYRFLFKDVVKFISSLDKYAPDHNAKLLDIGCGDKPYKKLFKKYNYTGIDSNPEISKPDVIGSITSLPFESGSFDACMTVWVLDDLPNPDNAVKEISRVLKSDGYYFAVEVQSAHQHYIPNDYFRFTPNALRVLCEKHKLEMISHKSYGGDFAMIGYSFISIFNRVFERIFAKYNFFKLLYSLVFNIIFFPADRIARLKIFRDNFERNSAGYCYVFRRQ